MIIADERLFGKVLSRQLEEILGFLEDGRQQRKRLDEVERGLFQRLLELGRVLLQQFIDEAGDGDVGEALEYDGQLLRRSLERHAKPYRCLFGILEACRYVYAKGEKQKALAIPLDERLGLPGGEQSYVLEDWMGRLTTRMPYPEAVALLREMGVNTSVRASETVVARLAEYVEDFRAGRAPGGAESEAAVLVVSADGKGVPMRRSLEQRLQEEHGVRPHKRQHKTPYEKAEKRRLRNTAASRKQMAYVGVAYSIAPWPRSAQSLLDELHRNDVEEQRPSPQNKRYWAEMTQVQEDQVCPGAARLFRALRQELLARDAARRKPWICLMDGQRSLWELQKKYLSEAIGILDLYHVTEKLWQVAYDFHPEASAAAEQCVDRYLRMLLEGKVGYVIGVLRRFLHQRAGHKLKTKGLKEAVRYFEANRRAMCYDEYLAAGYPIGSGVVEGACRHVVKDRMECSGMRWQIEGAQAMLHLRTMYLNGEWSAFMKHRIQTEQNRLYGQAG
jgi:hypothetical protein